MHENNAMFTLASGWDQKKITKHGVSINGSTLNWDFSVHHCTVFTQVKGKRRIKIIVIRIWKYTWKNSYYQLITYSLLFSV
jgi:hypothetical protein